MALVCLLVLTLGLAAVSQTNAALVANLGTLDIGDSDFTVQFQSPGAFVDDYTFQVSEPVNISGAAASFNLFGALNISDFSASLFQGPLGDVSNPLASDSGAIVSLFAANLQPSTDYFFRVTGVADGVFGGVYQAEYEVSAVPVPPALFLFLSALLGLFGFSRLRRRRAMQAG